MPSRAAHTKSRHGCIRCKQRRVKCDEGKPCRDCHRRNEFCSLVTDPAYVANFKNGQLVGPGISSPGTPNSSFSATGSPSTPPRQQNDLFAFFPAYQHSLPTGTPYIDWAEDLRLMAHWASSTSKTLLSRPGGWELFRGMAPEVAVKFPPTMHIMLSLSALHLSYLHPDEREKYSTLSSRHQHHATQQLQVAMSNITKDNFVPIFLTSSMLSIVCLANLSLAKPGGHSSIDHQPSLDDVVVVFFMTRGVRDILYPYWDWLLEPSNASLLRPILYGYTLKPHGTYQLPLDLAQRIDTLHKVLLEKHTGYHDASKEACHFALLELEKVLMDVVHMPSERPELSNPEYRKRTDLELGVVMKWLTSVSATYVNLLKKEHIAALVILAHWVMLLKHIGEKWFLAGWMATAFGLIKDALKEEDRHWVEWPEKYVQGDDGSQPNQQ